MSTDNCDVPYVERKEYQLVHIDSEGFLALYDEGIPKQDIRIGETGVDAELREVFNSYVTDQKLHLSIFFLFSMFFS
jgi:hypothetical protein